MLLWKSLKLIILYLRNDHIWDETSNKAGISIFNLTAVQNYVDRGLLIVSLCFLSLCSTYKENSHTLFKDISIFEIKITTCVKYGWPNWNKKGTKKYTTLTRYMVSLPRRTELRSTVEGYGQGTHLISPYNSPSTQYVLSKITK